MSDTNVEKSILELERAVLNRWCKGDPHGFTDNAVDDVTYFDHLSRRRVDGLRALKEHLRHFEGAVDVPRYEMPNARVMSSGNVAVLTFNWESYSVDDKLTSRWNATEVYVRSGDRWQYGHIHWAPVVTEG